MKKNNVPATSSEPMGIVITMGSWKPIEPLVRAYVWGPVPDEPSSSDGSRSA